MSSDRQPFEVEEAGDAEEPKKKSLPPEEALFGTHPWLWYGLGIIFTLAALSMMLIATLLPDWSYMLRNGRDHGYALFECIDCPDKEQGGSWGCLMQEACTVSEDSGLCQTAKGLYEAGAVFLALELFGMLMTLLIVERFVYLIFGRAYGSAGSVYCVAVFMFALQVAAVGAWFGISGAEFSADCSTEPEIEDELWEVCAESAPAIAIANLIICAFVGLYICIVVSARPAKADQPAHVEQVGRNHFLCCENRYVMLPLFLFLMSHLVLVIASLGVKQWSRTNDGQGSLYAAEHFGGVNNYGYDCIQAAQCEFDGDSGVCKTYSDLYKAGWGYNGLEIAALFFFVLWMEPTFYQVAGHDFGIPLLNYVWPLFFFISHFTATVMWFRVSEGNYEVTCDGRPDSSTTKWDICATSGPSIALANLVLFAFTYPAWAVVYYNRTVYVPHLKSKSSADDDELQD